MMTTKIEHLKLDIFSSPKVAALVIYEENELTKNKDFIKYVEELFKTFGIEKAWTRLEIIADPRDYIINAAFLRDFYNHPMENHIVVFNNGKLTEYMTVVELEKVYENETNKYRL